MVNPVSLITGSWWISSEHRVHRLIFELRQTCDMEDGIYLPVDVPNNKAVVNYTKGNKKFWGLVFTDSTLLGHDKWYNSNIW